MVLTAVLVNAWLESSPINICRKKFVTTELLQKFYTMKIWRYTVHGLILECTYSNANGDETSLCDLHIYILTYDIIV